MQKVICPYCGRVAKYVDSSVIYYGHSYGMAYAKYRVGNTYIKTDLSDVAVLPNGTVRAQLTISAESTPLTVTRVELYNSDNALWAHQDCSITVNTGQTGILYWFDFTVTEQVVKKLLAKDAKPTQNYVVTEQEVK